MRAEQPPPLRRAPLRRAPPEGLIQRSERLVGLQQRAVGAAGGERERGFGVAGAIAKADLVRVRVGARVRARVRVTVRIRVRVKVRVTGACYQEVLLPGGLLYSSAALGREEWLAIGPGLGLG